MSEHEIPIETQDGVMTTFLAHPDGDGPFPGRVPVRMPADETYRAEVTRV